MKKFTFLLLLAFGFSLANAQTSVDDKKILSDKVAVDWKESFKVAVKSAKKSNKPILIFFTGSDWCGPCKRLHKELFETKEFKDFSDKNFTLYEADFPMNVDLVTPENRKVNTELGKKYNKEESYPAIVIIKPDGTVVDRKDGSYMTDIYFPFFKEALNKK